MIQCGVDLPKDGGLELGGEGRLLQGLVEAFHVETNAGVDGRLLQVVQLVEVGECQHLRRHHVRHAEGHGTLGCRDERIDLETMNHREETLSRRTCNNQSDLSKKPCVA